MGTRRGSLQLTAKFTYPEVSPVSTLLFQGILIWMGDRLDWYEKHYIRPLVSDWKSQDQPKFRHVFKGGGSTAHALWSTTSTPFIYLDQGIKRRRVRIKKGSAPKTKNRTFKSVGPGAMVKRSRGKKVFFRKKDKGQRVIRARNWTDEIAKRETKLLAGRPNSMKGGPGVLFSMFEQVLFAKKVDMGFIRFKLNGGAFKTPKLIYPLPFVQKEITTVRAVI